MKKLGYEPDPDNQMLSDAILIEAAADDLVSIGNIGLDLDAKRRMYYLLPRLWTLYFVASVEPGLIKIGRTRTLKRRMTAIKASSPVPVTLIACVQYDKFLENRVHKRFAHLRSHGEWFKAEPELINFVRGVKSGGVEYVVSEVGDAESDYLTNDVCLQNKSLQASL